MSNGNHQPLVPPPGQPFKLSTYAPDYKGSHSKDDAEAELPALRERLNDLQNIMWASKAAALLVVLQGIDTAGKDSTINSVFQAVGPLGASVVNFGVPSERELAHDYLWRYHLACPERGSVVIFNRSHYEAVVVERVKGLVPKEVWKQRYEQINSFERYLVETGTVICKFFLHISKDEQRERLQERVDNPKKRWKFREGDLAERERWDDYQAAFEEMVARCNTAEAPWNVVPADRKWYRDLVIARALVARLEALDLKYPPSAPGVEGTIVR